MDVYKYYKDLPPWGKFAVLAGVGLGGWVVYNRVRNYFNKQKALKGQQMVASDAGRELNVLASKGVRPTYSDSQYSGFASAIQKAFDGCDPGNDDYAAVMSAMNAMKNDADIAKLISVFGVRKWDECGWLAGDVELDLVGGIRHELDNNQINVVNKVLRDKGIKFQF
jgi:hypothetical protein